MSWEHRAVGWFGHFGTIWTVINLNSNEFDFFVHRGIRYARPGDLRPRVHMANSEDEFMPIYVAVSAAFVANNPKHLPAGRRAGVGSTHDARPMPRFLELT